jgi:hypothetical protein
MTLLLALVAFARADCPTSLVADREHSTHIIATASSCWGAWGRDRAASQADVRAWLAWWEHTWIGVPVEEVPGMIRYDATGSLGPCGWSVQARIDLAEDHRLDSHLEIDLDPLCGPILGRATLKRVEQLGQPFATEWRPGSDVPGAF